MNSSNLKKKVSCKKHSAQFKDQSLEYAKKHGIPQAAKDLGLAESMLYSWRASQKRGGQPLEQQKLEQAEFDRLKRENNRLAEENSFLKKAAAYFAKESK